MYWKIYQLEVIVLHPVPDSSSSSCIISELSKRNTTPLINCSNYYAIPSIESTNKDDNTYINISEDLSTNKRNRSLNESDSSNKNINTIKRIKYSNPGKKNNEKINFFTLEVI